MTSRYTYSREYQELAETKDGRQVLLRMITPADRDKLLAGFERLSPRSRYRRFFSSKRGLTDAELSFFTETDGYDHFALGAALLEVDGSEGPGAGIGRFIRVPGEPAVAEVAITVIDDFQGVGLGRILLERIIEAAAERDVTRLRFHLLAENEQIRELIRKVCDCATYHSEEGFITAEIELPALAPLPVPSIEPLDRLFELLRAVASSTLEPQLAVSRDFLASTVHLLTLSGLPSATENEPAEEPSPEDHSRQEKLGESP